MSLDLTIRTVQKALGVAVDGNPGPQTWGGVHAHPNVLGQHGATDNGDGGGA